MSKCSFWADRTHFRMSINRSTSLSLNFRQVVAANRFNANAYAYRRPQAMRMHQCKKEWRGKKKIICRCRENWQKFTYQLIVSWCLLCAVLTIDTHFSVQFRWQSADGRGGEAINLRFFIRFRFNFYWIRYWLNYSYYQIIK